MGELCAICHDNLDADHAHGLPCGHAFHSKCLIAWLTRCPHQPTCPMCRDDLHGHREKIPNMALRERGAYLRNRYCRRLVVPPQLKKLIGSLQRAEAVHKEVKKRVAEFRRQHGGALSEYRKLLRRESKSRHKCRERLRLLGLYNDRNETLPNLEVLGR